MKKNGFVQAVTRAINADMEERWSQEYWIGPDCDWADNRSGPFMDAVHHGPEFDEYVMVKMFAQERQSRKST